MVTQHFGDIHYLHLGSPGQHLYVPIKEFSIQELFNRYSASRRHTGNFPSKGLSMLPTD